MKVFIVEDDKEIQELESYALKSSGFDAACFSDSIGFFKAVQEELPELVLLDIMLPGTDGLEILRRLRADRRTAKVPVIIVSAKTSEMDTVRGLDMGADDYLTKPFGVMELVSRVKARIRRMDKKDENIIVCGNIELNDDKHSVTSCGQPCELTYKEYELLKQLLLSNGKVLTRERIMEAVWGYDFEGNSRTVDMHIKTLRKKLGKCGGYISTVRNIGYMLEEQIE